MTDIVWVDDQIGQYERATRRFRIESPRFVFQSFTDATSAWENYQALPVLASGGLRALIVDLMLASGEDEYFSSQKTDGYLLTGLTLLDKMVAHGELPNRYTRVVIYTALTDAKRYARAEAWVTKASADSLNSHLTFELIKKSLVGTEELVGLIEKDLV